MVPPKIAILVTDGSNCDEETYFAFKLAGANPIRLHINQLLQKKADLLNYQILAIPGGFTYGDDVLSGKILASQLLYRLGEMINKFIDREKLVIGICNGFQVLVRMGVLPWPMKPAEDCSLIFNNSGHLECRWIRLKIKKSNCIFTKNLEEEIIDIPVAHGEGKFIVKNKDVLEKIKRKNLVVCQYIDKNDKATMEYPLNPNGAIEAIAGICNKTGRIFGLMPHPERAIFFHQLPNYPFLKEKYLRERKKFPTEGPGLAIFRNGVSYFQ